MYTDILYLLVGLLLGSLGMILLRRPRQSQRVSVYRMMRPARPLSEFIERHQKTRE